MGWRDLVKTALHKTGYDITRYPLMTLLKSRRIDLIFDVGAHSGQYARMIRSLGYRGRIVSFEPQSAVFAELMAGASADPFWEARRMALGESRRSDTIHISGLTASSSLREMRPKSFEIDSAFHQIGSEEIEVHTLDSVFDEYFQTGNRAFLKIDTQGYEKNVLEGALGSLKRISGLQVEMSLVELYEGETLMTGIIELLKEQGFSLMWLEPGFKDPATHQLFQVDGLFFRV